MVKLLYDKVELDTHHGRLTVGILVLQDVAAIIVMAFQPNLSHPDPLAILGALGGTLALLAVGFGASRFVLAGIFKSIANAPEMVVAASLGWCAAIAGLASYLHLSPGMGALIAGLAISAFPYSIHVTAKTVPLRDVFLTLFFVSLGMGIPRPDRSLVLTVPLIIAMVVLSRFLTVMPLAMIAKVGRRTAFITSLNLSQIGEFSLVLLAQGVAFHHISSDLMGPVIYAMAATAVISSYAIKYSHGIYRVIERLLNRAGLGTRIFSAAETGTYGHRPIVILGMHRGARLLVQRILDAHPGSGKRILVIDYNPEVLAGMERLGVGALFGDIGSIDTLRHAHIDQARVVVATIPDMLLKGTSNRAVVGACRLLSSKVRIIATADGAEQGAALVAAGADAVLMPYDLVADQALALLGDVLP